MQPNIPTNSQPFEISGILQLYDQQNQHINKWALFNYLAQEYFTEGGICVVIGTSPPPPRHPTQTDIGSAFAQASSALLKFWNAFTNYSNPLKENTVVQLPENVFILGNDIIGSSIYRNIENSKDQTVNFSMILQK